MSEHTTELLNCPFCGAADSVQTEIDPAGSLTTDAGTTRFNESWMVVCNVNKGGCGASSGVQHATEASAIAAWNRRSYATALCQQGERDAKDAARYRWLRAKWHRIEAYTDHDSHALVMQVNEFGGTLADNERLDAAIDAALSTSEGKTE